MESFRIAQRRENCNTTSPKKGLLACCPPLRVPDRPQVNESQRVLKEKCPIAFVNGIPKKVIEGQPIDFYSQIVRTTPSSEITSQLKDGITQAELDIRFFEFFKPRPPPPDFLIVPRERNNAGEPKARGGFCAPGQIKTVG
jgi:hypothetical protein